MSVRIRQGLPNNCEYLVWAVPWAVDEGSIPSLTTKLYTCSLNGIERKTFNLEDAGSSPVRCAKYSMIVYHIFVHHGKGQNVTALRDLNNALLA